MSKWAPKLSANQKVLFESDNPITLTTGNFGMKKRVMMSCVVAESLKGGRPVLITTDTAKVVAAKMRSLGFKCRAIGKCIVGRTANNKWSFTVSTHRYYV